MYPQTDQPHLIDNIQKKFVYFYIILLDIYSEYILLDIYMCIYIYNYIYMALIFRWIQLFQPCPAAGTFEMAAKPLGTSANFKPADGDK